jgi:SAM-dependent methyltransferase
MSTAGAGDFDYERAGDGYATARRPDPRIAALVHAALGHGASVVNVGAGAGSYEPSDRAVVAVEPSAAMRSQRPPAAAPVIDAVAEALPFADRAFDAAMAMVTVHQWRDKAAGLRELRRVSRGPVVVLTFEAAALDRLWLDEYAPELAAAERHRYPSLAAIDAALGGGTEAVPVPVARDCPDGFTEAYYARPEAFLEERVRRGQSAWAFLAPGVEERFVERLGAALASGEWDRRHGPLRQAPEFVGALRLVVQPGPT